MDIQASKEERVKLIYGLEDSILLYKLRKITTREKKDFYEELTEDQKLGIQQLDRSESISRADFKTRRRNR